MGLSSTPITQPRKFPTSGFDTINSTILFEEESLPGYLKAHYYPVCLGEVLNTRYQILTKLGFGSTSTVWLCRDLHQNRYLTLKVHVRSTQPPPDVQISQHLKSLQSTHTGQRYTRIALDSFQIRGPHGPHHCTLYQPAGIDIRDYIHCLEGDALPENLLRVTVRFMLVALDYLHEAKVVHTDINPHNILLGIDDTSILTEMEEDELSNPAPQKLLSDRTIFATRAMPLSTGEPVLADLGEARIAQTTQTGLIMPSVYRAPEVMLGMQWDEKVDVWGLGQTAWTLFEQGHLFTTPDLESEMDHARRFAEMMALLGPPPVEFLRRSERSWRFWDENGKWNGRVDIPEQSLETRETRLQGDGKVLFLRFLRKALSWVPEDRPTAKELLMDEWVRGDDY
ncbi:kinase-like protein [Aspergillus ibericus CBS 121593]|uniref:non-specific serine/threonine protein kinase n=1 Tax=Aspergillus ibericus CBS 121593 TaxID=1448316 RepID=A0A395GLR1_9EURO|nr:kinase-like protein [Aspergillus ibericus CBS 121593]RAK96409.1 kinase-like protein [Aspergillus ibericus CBS 121593]